MKVKRLFLNALCSVAMAAAVFCPVAAEEGDNGTTPSGMEYEEIAGGTMTFDKYLVLDKTANVPSAAFSFAVTAGTAVSASEDSYEIKAGPDADKVTVQTAEFTVSDEKSTDADAFPGTLESGKAYAKKTVTVDFSAVTFDEPGMYRYVLTEEDSTSASIVNDSAPVRYIDVYVINDADNKLSVNSYVLHMPESASDTTLVKDFGYINSYTSHDLIIAKKVEGNAGSVDEYFKFTVQISNAAPGAEYPVDLTNADAQTKKTGYNSETYTNPNKITVGDDGTVEAVFWLQHNQSIVIQGLAEETKYTIFEDNATLDEQGYTTTIEATGSDNDQTTANDTRTVSDTTGITADTKVTFTNTRNEVIPTGIVNKVAPYALAILAAGVFFFLSRKVNVEQ